MSYQQYTTNLFTFSEEYGTETNINIGVGKNVTFIVILFIGRGFGAPKRVWENIRNLKKAGGIWFENAIKLK